MLNTKSIKTVISAAALAMVVFANTATAEAAEDNQAQTQLAQLSAVINDNRLTELLEARHVATFEEIEAQFDQVQENLVASNADEDC